MIPFGVMLLNMTDKATMVECYCNYFSKKASIYPPSSDYIVGDIFLYPRKQTVAKSFLVQASPKLGLISEKLFYLPPNICLQKGELA